MNDYQILQDIGRSKSAMVYKVAPDPCIFMFDGLFENHDRTLSGKEKENNRIFRPEMCGQKPETKNHARGSPERKTICSDA